MEKEMTLPRMRPTLAAATEDFEIVIILTEHQFCTH